MTYLIISPEPLKALESEIFSYCEAAVKNILMNPFLDMENPSYANDREQQLEDALIHAGIFCLNCADMSPARLGARHLAARNLSLKLKRCNGE